MECRCCRTKLDAGKWLCGLCGKWTRSAAPLAGLTVPLSQVVASDVDRIATSGFWADLTGGGFVRGTSVVIGGEPGGGKSTVALQIADTFADESNESDGRTVYLPTEEKPSMIRARASRLQCEHLDKIVVPTVELTPDLEFLDEIEPPGLIILDSLPDLVGGDKNLAVVVCKRLTNYARETDAVVLILDHVTKGEELAGLMHLQHAVDLTVYLRSVGKLKRRVWETIKNRHGAGFLSCDLVMTARGLMTVQHDEQDERVDGQDIEDGVS